MGSGLHNQVHLKALRDGSVPIRGITASQWREQELLVSS